MKPPQPRPASSWSQPPRASDLNGQPTQVFQLGLAGLDDRRLQLELTEAFDFDKPNLLPEMTAHLAGEAKRLRNPRPECYVTLGGLPLAFGKFQWPFHRSTSGADTYIVHGEISPRRRRHAQPARQGRRLRHASPSPRSSPPWSSPTPRPSSTTPSARPSTIGQLEFVKSGNRQPVPVTTRFYSRWQKKFVFTETDDNERLRYLLSKVYWLSGVLGESKPVWIADPRDAQYLNTTEADLLRMAGHEAGEGLMMLDGEFAAATPQLMARAAEYQAARDAALNFTKPQFNESMRSGHANM